MSIESTLYQIIVFGLAITLLHQRAIAGTQKMKKMNRMNRYPSG
jgi:hypothetical protein